MLQASITILILGALVLTWIGGNALAHGGLHGIALSAAAIVIALFALIYQSHEQHQELVALLESLQSNELPGEGN